MALDLQGFRSNVLDAALSPLAVGSLAEEERGNVLLKRAELKIAMSERCVDSMLADLTESVKLSPRNAKAWCIKAAMGVTKRFVIVELMIDEGRRELVCVGLIVKYYGVHSLTAILVGFVTMVGILVIRKEFFETLIVFERRRVPMKKSEATMMAHDDDNEDTHKGE
ncbi:hypothetical protein JHK86_001427 [Glycine max]|nr:hypothetical protein JHK86_001427 [Glycine max]